MHTRIVPLQQNGVRFGVLEAALRCSRTALEIELLMSALLRHRGNEYLSNIVVPPHPIFEVIDSPFHWGASRVPGIDVSPRLG